MRFDRSLPTHAISAHERAEAFAAGCNAYETKPLDADRFIQKVNALLA